MEDAHHGQLDHVSRTALNGGIDRISLGIASDNRIVRMNIRQETLTLEDRFHIALLTCHLNALFHIGLDAGIGLEITLNQLLCLAPRDVQPLGQTEDRDTIDYTEVSGLRLPTHVARHLCNRNTIDLGRSSGMDIRPTLKGLNHVRILAQVRHDTQLDLRIVG